MKIGIVTTWFERGAAYVSRQYKDLLENSNEVFIYARGGEDFALESSVWNSGNVTWDKSNKWTTRTKININHFKNWIISNELDIILFNEQHEWKPVIEANKLGVKIGSYIDYYKKETKDLFNIYDFLICNTQRHYSVFEQMPQTLYLPWGTDVNLFKPKTLLPIGSQIVFFHSAGMNPLRKGTDFILKAARDLKDKKFKVIIHSQVNLKEFFPALSSIIDDLINTNKLEIIDKTVSAPGLYYLGDVYIYPTRLEGIGLTVPEAISCGLPTITTNQAPMNEFVKENINGALIDVDYETPRNDNYYWDQSIISLDSLIKKMLYYINNFSNIEEYKISTRNYAINFLNWDNNKEELNKFFSKVNKISLEEKEECIKNILSYERNRPFKYYLNTFKPYLKFKKKIKFLLKK